MDRVLFRNCQYLITRAAPSGIVENGGLLVEGPSIVAAGPSVEIEQRCAHQPDVEVIDASHKLVMPGLVDAHNHVGEAHALLVEGWLPSPVSGLVDALERIYWPADGWLDEQSAYDLTLLGLVNALKHGATTHANASALPDAVYRASVESGARAVIQPQMVSSVALHGMGEREHLAKTEEAIRSYHGTHGGRIQVGVHPNGTFNCTERMLIRAMEMAEQYDVHFATHIAESPDEKERADALWADEGGLVAHLRRIGLITPRTVFFHGTLLDEREIDVLVEAGAALVHCPATNAWFGYCAYLPYMLKAGLRVGLGTDCPTHNLFGVMLSVLQHHNIMPRAMRGIDPATIFELATLGGAHALGLADQVGTLEAGKRADIATIDLSRNTSLFPLDASSLFAMLALNGAGAQTCDVMVDGVFVRRDGEFTSLDEEAIVARTQEWCDRFGADYRAAAQAGRPLVRRIHDEFQRG